MPPLPHSVPPVLQSADVPAHCGLGLGRSPGGTAIAVTHLAVRCYETTTDTRRGPFNQLGAL